MADKDILILCEAGKGQTESTNASLIASAAKLAEFSGGRLVCLLVGNAVSEAVEQISHYVDEVRFIDSPDCANYNPLIHLAALQQLVAELAPSAILFGHTYVGMDLAPRLSARLNAAVATNCFDVVAKDGVLHFVRSMYRGRIIATVTFDSAPIVATFQQSSTKVPVTRAVKGQIVTLSISANVDNRIRPLKTIEPASTGIDITKSDIVVAGGRGVGEKENFSLVDELAQALQGVAACSRPLVDMGWFTTSSQVGMSGNTVKPKLYVACGISGAVEHIHGMKESGTIVAINKDPDAPIFKIADYGIVGDLLEILPALTMEVRRVRNQQQ